MSTSYLPSSLDLELVTYLAGIAGKNAHESRCFVTIDHDGITLLAPSGTTHLEWSPPASVRIVDCACDCLIDLATATATIRLLAHDAPAELVRVSLAHLLVDLAEVAIVSRDALR